MARTLSNAVPTLPDREANRAKDTYLAGLERFPQALHAPGRELLERIATPNWAIEWALPHWLGQTFGLWGETTRALTAANVLGLAYVRLSDDMVDGDQPSGARGTEPLLATALYHLWLEQYRKLFAGSSPFWRAFDGYLVQWQRGTLRDHAPDLSTRQPLVDDAHALELAERGAPLKASATGACLLAFRADDIPAAEAALDHLLGAAVLLDHVQDWRDDFAAGRYNAFVSFAAQRQDQSGEEAGDEEAIHRAVLQELFLGDTAAPYFALIGRLVDRARKEARPLACIGLARYLDHLEQSAAYYRTRLAEHAAGELRAGVDKFFGENGEPEFGSDDMSERLSGS